MNILQQPVEKTVGTFTLRPATWDDLDAVVELCNRASIDMIGRPEQTPESVREEWTTPKFDLATNVRVVVSAEGQLVGYVEVWDMDPLPVDNWVWARTDPDFYNQGIGTMMMNWAEERLQDTLARVPEDVQVSYKCGTVDGYEPSNQFLTDRGLKLVRKFWRMQIELDQPTPEPQWADGIRITNLAETGDVATLYHAFDEAFQDHWGHVDQPAEDGIKRFEHWVETGERTDPSIWFMAMDGDEIAAVCLCSKYQLDDPDMGWINILGVRRPWRKRGLGLALLHHAFGMFREMGRLRAGLGVDASSLTGATRLYERAGMSPSLVFNDYEKVLRPGRVLTRETLEE